MQCKRKYKVHTIYYIQTHNDSMIVDYAIIRDTASTMYTVKLVQPVVII